ncbi:MAG TPA: helix-turn-helix transcriptional regulator, partial [Ktedonobacteraceae bacterium]|nr:helix-turn-helix transcriptional regulator [Ktedonobacteraceae bacterium]
METTRDSARNQRLRQARIERNWRQRELAEQLGTTVQTVKRWERGSQQPSMYFRAKLLTLFGKSVEELGLDEKDPSLPQTEENVPETEQIGTFSAEAEGIWMVPYARNPHFTGRDDLLEHLVQELSLEPPGNVTAPRRAILSQPQAITGLGGIGKTQIAVEYAYQAQGQDRYTHTFWINAASEDAMLTSFQMLAEHLPSFAEKDEHDQHKLIAAVLRW